jgi:hypothetical protein
VHFVWGVNPPACSVCSGFHSADNGCNVTVNLKRVSDEAGPVLKGIGEVLAVSSRIQSELPRTKIVTRFTVNSPISCNLGAKYSSVSMETSSSPNRG